MRRASSPRSGITCLHLQLLPKFELSHGNQSAKHQCYRFLSGQAGRHTLSMHSKQSQLALDAYCPEVAVSQDGRFGVTAAQAVEESGFKPGLHPSP